MGSLLGANCETPQIRHFFREDVEDHLKPGQMWEIVGAALSFVCYPDSSRQAPNTCDLLSITKHVWSIGLARLRKQFGNSFHCPFMACSLPMLSSLTKSSFQLCVILFLQGLLVNDFFNRYSIPYSVIG